MKSGRKTRRTNVFVFCDCMCGWSRRVDAAAPRLWFSQVPDCDFSPGHPRKGRGGDGPEAQASADHHHWHMCFSFFYVHRRSPQTHKNRRGLCLQRRGGSPPLEPETLRSPWRGNVIPGASVGTVTPMLLLPWMKVVALSDGLQARRLYPNLPFNAVNGTRRR